MDLRFVIWLRIYMVFGSVTGFWGCVNCLAGDYFSLNNNHLSLLFACCRL